MRPSDDLAAIRDQGVLTVEPHSTDDDFLLVLRASRDDVGLLDWASSQREEIQRLLREHGALLFRGFRDSLSARDFERFIEATSEGELLEYTQGSTPREAVGGRISTATIYPKDRAIPLHHELCYTRSWPRKLWLFCHRAADAGGKTPLADGRRVFERIDAGIREQFIAKRVMYVRNYGELIDVPWQKAFLTDDRSRAEAICREAGIEFEWQEDGSLRTTQVCQAVADHPETGETVWFNQAHLFHVSSLPPKRQKQLKGLFGERNLPRNAYFGDGSPIDVEALDAIRDAYESCRISFEWQRGDLVMLDNMRAAHGREPYRGERMIWFGMAEAYSPDA